MVSCKRGSRQPRAIASSAGRSPDKQILLQAAGVAAWHSKARHGGRVAVCYAAVHQISKERGAKAGSVSVKKSKTLQVKPALPAPLE